MGRKPSQWRPTSHALERQIASLAERQHRNVTRTQLLKLGLGKKAIDYRVRSGRLHHEHRGVYSVGTPAKTALEKASAAVLACGPGALLSHESALALWGLRAGGWPWGGMEVTVHGDREHPGIRVHRSRTLTRRDRRRRYAIPVTSVARTLLDCAPRLSDRALTRAVNDALRNGSLKREQLSELLRRCANHPGAKRIRPHAVAEHAPTRSDLEDDFLAFCARFGLPRPRVNARIGGYEVDAYFEREKLIVELDGWQFHNDREAFERDRLRDADALVNGTATVRITRARLRGRPQREAERLQAILRGRRAAPG